MKFLLQIIPIFIFFIVLVSSISTILYFSHLKKKNKKSPLNFKLLRLPGETLQNQINDLDIDIILSLLTPPLYILFIYSAFLSGNYYSANTHANIPIILILSSILVAIYFIKQSIGLISKRNNIRVGLEAERAVGEELNRICSLGGIAYHDFPADNFNIDHILISKSGIYAIETKGRSKLKDKDNNWKVQYVNNKLIFPNREESKPVKQAQMQAQWLSNFLSKKLRVKVQVNAVLAIPGWYTDIKQKPQNIIITNGRNLTFLTKGKKTLDENKILAVSNILEEKCRNVEHLSYQKPTIANK